MTDSDKLALVLSKLDKVEGIEKAGSENKYRCTKQAK